MVSQQLQTFRANYCERQTLELFDHLPRGKTPVTRSKVSEERKENFGKPQVGCGTRKGAEIAAHLFRNILEMPCLPKRMFSSSKFLKCT